MKGVSSCLYPVSCLFGGGNKDGAIRLCHPLHIQFHKPVLKKSVFCQGQSTDFFYSTRKLPQRREFTEFYNLFLYIATIVPRCRSPPLLTFWLTIKISENGGQAIPLAQACMLISRHWRKTSSASTWPAWWWRKKPGRYWSQPPEQEPFMPRWQNPLKTPCAAAPSSKRKGGFRELLQPYLYRLARWNESNTSNRLILRK